MLSFVSFGCIDFINVFILIHSGIDHNTASGTDIYIYAVQDHRLVKSEEMIKVLSTALPQAKNRLAHHGLLEVRAGAQTLAAPSESESTDEEGSSAGGLGSLEIAVLGMACAVFLGALVAVISIFCLRVKRQV